MTRRTGLFRTFGRLGFDGDKFLWKTQTADNVEDLDFFQESTDLLEDVDCSRRVEDLDFLENVDCSRRLEDMYLVEDMDFFPEDMDLLEGVYCSRRFRELDLVEDRFFWKSLSRIPEIFLGDKNWLQDLN